MNVDYCLALDIGATNIKYGVVARNISSESALQLKDFQMEPTDRSFGPEGLVDQVVKIYKAATSAYKEKSLTSIPVGICAAGPLDPVEGRLLIPANLTDGGAKWSNFPLVEKVRERLGVDVCLENDAAAAALGELWLGAGQGVQNFMVLTLGTGLGAAVVREGQIVRATGGLHTELGHSIIDFNETPALEEARVPGSLESYLGPKFFLMRFSKAYKRQVTGEEFIELVKAKDSLALEWTATYQRVLVAGMFNFFLAFAPDLFIYQGGFSPLIDLIKEDLQNALKLRVEGFRRPDRPAPGIETSAISRTCGVYGAAYRIFNS